ncbi:ATP-binding protein [Candidatus Woesearchaeota archaeon]|nr:ATP-binding protein [Candidatus Woesearchaeota archaeon]
MARIGDFLLDFNVWWKGSFKAEFKERFIYSKLAKFLPLPQIIALTGLRRVGKTTLMLRLVEDFIRQGFEPQNIVYFSFDEFKDVELRQVIAEYERLMGKDFKSGRYLLLFDEIQKLADWESQIKSLYDLSKGAAKIVISGSESLFIRMKSRETLAGRLFEFKIEPLTFAEFLAFKGEKFEPVGLYGKELSRLFQEFAFSLGFPELVGITDKDVIKKYVKESIIEKVIYRDLATLFGIRDISIVEALLNIFSEEPGQLIELSDLAKELKISRQAVSTYLNYLEKSFLLRKLYNFSGNRRKTERKLKKYYPAIISPELLFRNDSLSNSKTFEWLAVNQLKAEFFWRDPYQHEVDVILANTEVLPVEIKYGKIDFSGLLAFMKRFNANSGYVISSEEEFEQKFGGKTISVIPAFKFLLIQHP